MRALLQVCLYPSFVGGWREEAYKQMCCQIYRLLPTIWHLKERWLERLDQQRVGMGSHVSCWYRQLFELSLNGFGRLCNGTNGPESPGTALPLLEKQLALRRVLLPFFFPIIMYSSFNALLTLKISFQLFQFIIVLWALPTSISV